MTILTQLSTIVFMVSIVILIALLILKAKVFMQKDKIKLKNLIIIFTIIAPCSLFMMIVSVIAGAFTESMLTVWCVHEYAVLEQQEANCTNSGYIKKICSLCNDEITETIESYHLWIEDSVIDATCSHPKQLINKCSVCGTTETVEEGAAIPHSFGNWTVSIEPTTENEGRQTRKCTVCNYIDNISILKKSPITIINQSYSIDFLGGVTLIREIRNNTNKTIKYITLEWECYNAVDDLIYDEITRKATQRKYWTGPFEPGTTIRLKATGFYNHTFSNAILTEIQIEFMDGKIITVSSKEYSDIFD